MILRRSALLTLFDIILGLVMKLSIMDSSEEFSLLTSQEAASYLRISVSTLHRLERSGLLSPLRTPGGHRRYTVDMLNRYLRLDLPTKTGQ